MAYPQGPQPSLVEYDDLIFMEPDDLFWNDKIYTNHQEAWVVDSKTQDGMRLQAQHKRIMPLMLGLSAQMDWATTRLQPVLSNPILQTLLTEDQVDCVKVIVYNHFICLACLQMQWDKHLCPLLVNTGPYAADQQLSIDWDKQIVRLTFLKQSGNLAMVEGDFDNVLGDSSEELDQTTMLDFLNCSAEPSATSTNTDNDGTDLDESNDKSMGPDEDDLDVDTPLGNMDELQRALEGEELNAAVARSIQLLR
ncbi:hypothetical protein PSTG_01354 [Puccinia striiformis f. sp. tritici PST-78]|uniref:Uncharacterized protein n=1 Tax=Puccinia striiformis f. sp. tritici PST-78 TaxID=1165861 RepID=A0A0L0W1X5_9BASI|nr:hypothetical protein PSTG_01354 [Puccinia striiformis f. sp. tritici PST-78]